MIVVKYRLLVAGRPKYLDTTSPKASLDYLLPDQQGGGMPLHSTLGS